MTTSKSVFSTILIVLLAAAILVGLWFGYWALRKASVENQYEVNTGTQQYQSGLISQQRDRVAAYDAASSDAQKKNIATTFCAVQQEITKVPEDLIQANARICY